MFKSLRVASLSHHDLNYLGVLAGLCLDNAMALLPLESPEKAPIASPTTHHDPFHAPLSLALCVFCGETPDRPFVLRCQHLICARHLAAETTTQQPIGPPTYDTAVAGSSSAMEMNNASALPVASEGEYRFRFLHERRLTISEKRPTYTVLPLLATIHWPRGGTLMQRRPRPHLANRFHPSSALYSVCPFFSLK